MSDLDTWPLEHAGGGQVGTLDCALCMLFWTTTPAPASVSAEVMVEVAWLLGRLCPVRIPRIPRMWSVLHIFHLVGTSNFHFASRDPLPFPAIRLVTLSSRRYSNEQSSGSIPSLTLWPCGLERSTMSLPLPGWLDLGITPIGLNCVPVGTYQLWRYRTDNMAQQPLLLQVLLYNSCIVQGRLHVGCDRAVVNRSVEANAEALLNAICDIFYQDRVWMTFQLLVLCAPS